MNHIQIRRALARSLTRTLALNHLPVSLHPYQTETLESTVRWLKRPRAPRRAYVAQATGLGKTVEYSTIVRACQGLRVLVIVPGKTLVEQSIQDLVGFSEGTIAHASSLTTITDGEGVELAKHWKGQQHDVVVTTDDTFKVRYELIRRELDPHVIIWDECHWAYTEKAQRALDHFPESVVVGFSATPDYLTTTAKSDSVPVTLDNGQVLYGAPDKFARAYFPECLDERSVRWGIENDFLAPLAWGQLNFKLPLDEIRIVNGPAGMDYDQAELQHVMRENWDFIVQTIRKLYKSGQYALAKRFSAAVCPGVHEAGSIAEELRGIGIVAESITEKTKDTEARNIIARGKKGELQFLSSVFKLREGWNSPNAEVAMMLRPTKSRVLYMQFMGRVLRLFRNKVALVLDPHYQNTRFAPLSAPILFEKPGQEVFDGDLLVNTRKKGRKPISPYLLRKLEPVLTVEKLEIEYWAGEDGTFEADGETWGTLEVLHRILLLSTDAIIARLSVCRKKEGRDRGGRVQTFYAVADAKKACIELLKQIPRAGKDGTFVAEGERWATIYILKRLFNISEKAIVRHLSSCRRRDGKNRAGAVLTFYAVADAKKAFASLPRAIHRAKRDGTIRMHGKILGTCYAIGFKLKLSPITVSKYIEQSSLKAYEGFDRQGKPARLYVVSEAKKACRHAQRKKPRNR